MVESSIKFFTLSLGRWSLSPTVVEETTAMKSHLVIGSCHCHHHGCSCGESGGWCDILFVVSWGTALCNGVFTLSNSRNTRYSNVFGWLGMNGNICFTFGIVIRKWLHLCKVWFLTHRQRALVPPEATVSWLIIVFFYAPVEIWRTRRSIGDTGA
jgi:hypothetical protein